MAYDDDFDDAEDTLRMRPISVPDPTLPGSSNRAVSQAQEREEAAARAAQARQPGVQPGAQPVDDETRVISLPDGTPAGQTRPDEAAVGLRGLESGAFQEEPEDGEEALTPEQLAARKKAKAAKTRLIAIVTVVVIAILAVGGVAGWLIWRNKATNAAMTNCRNAASSLEEATRNFTAERDAAATKSALAVTSSQVVDGSSISSLHDITSRTPPSVLSCSTSLSMDKLTEHATTMAGDAADLTKAVSTMKADVKSITASKNAKLVSDARTSLTQLISSAQQTATQQVNNVQDSSTISTLQSAIASGQKLLAGKSATLSELTKASQNISTAVAAVNTSVQAKQKAQEEEKAKQEAEEKAKQEEENKNSDSDSSDSDSNNSDNNNQNSQNSQSNQGNQGDSNQNNGQNNG